MQRGPMKVTVEISDQEMQEVLELTGENKKGPAIRQLLDEALQLRRRAQVAERFTTASGAWSSKASKPTATATAIERLKRSDATSAR
jgi:hypothetical protein